MLHNREIYPKIAIVQTVSASEICTPKILLYRFNYYHIWTQHKNLFYGLPFS